eukprot:10465328-Alexandrium_andersonii.AAC.1
MCIRDSFRPGLRSVPGTAEQEIVPGSPTGLVEPQGGRASPPPAQLDADSTTLQMGPHGWEAVLARRRNSEQHALTGN